MSCEYIGRVYYVCFKLPMHRTSASQKQKIKKLQLVVCRSSYALRILN